MRRLSVWKWCKRVQFVAAELLHICSPPPLQRRTVEADPGSAFQTGSFVKGRPLTWAAPALNKHASCQNARSLALSLSHQPDNASLASNATMLKGVQRWPSPRCWSSRCSRRTSETPVLQCPTSGSECSSPLFLPRCCRWWATCGPPPSSGWREEKHNREIGSQTTTFKTIHVKVDSAYNW